MPEALPASHISTECVFNALGLYCAIANSRIPVDVLRHPYDASPQTCGVLNEETLLVCGAVGRITEHAKAEVQLDGTCLNSVLSQPGEE